MRVSINLGHYSVFEYFCFFCSSQFCEYMPPFFCHHQGGLEGKRDGLEDLDFYMGNDALKHSTTHQISYPIRHGLIEVLYIIAVCTRTVL